MWTRGQDWYEHQTRFAAQSRDAAEKLVVVERAVFSEAMCWLTNCVDTVVSLDPPPDDLATKRILGLATHACNLLCSSWESTLAGRSDAAQAHIRSINEIPDFIMALYVEPECAEQMGDRDWNVDKSRRVVAKNLDKLKSGRGKQWKAMRKDTSNSDQAFSHVSVEAQGMALGVGVKDGEKIGVLRPGGVVALPILRPTALIVASSAAVVALTAMITLGDHLAFESEHFDEVEKIGSRWISALGNNQYTSDIPEGELQEIVYLLSGENPPDPRDTAAAVAAKVIRQ